jgi:hypothetical protein
MAKEVVYKATLDASKLVSGLKDISDGIDKLQKSFDKALVVKIDTSQFSALQLTITRSFDRLGSKLVNDFDANTNKIIATLNKLGPAAATVGQEIGAQLAKGMTAGANNAAKQVESTTEAMAQRLQDRLQNIFNGLHASYSRLGSAYGPGAQSLLNEKLSAQKLALPQNLNDLTINGAGKYESKTYVDAIRRAFIDTQTEVRKTMALESEFQKMNARIGPVMGDGSFVRGGNAAQIGPLMANGAFGFGGSGRFSNAAAEKQAAADAKAAQTERAKLLAAEEAAQKRIAVATQGTKTSQDGVGASLLQSISLTLRWLLVFRVIRDVTQAIEQSIGALISSGSQFIKAQETQTLGLQGILAENFTLVDLQGKQLQGTARLNALQSDAKEQWTGIAKMALQTGGSTEQLVHLYERLLPLASRYGKSLEDAQKMTLNASLAGKFLGMSDDTLASSINGLLMGRAPARNPLVSALGLSTADVAQLKNTPALFDKIQEKLQGLVETAGPEFQTTFTAMSAKFQDFLAKIGAEIDQPFIERFKQFVGLLEGKLFVGGTGTFTPVLASFLQTLKAAAAEVLQPLDDFGHSLSATAGRDAPAFVLGLATVAKSIVQLGVYVAQAVIAVTEFVSRHSEMFSVLSTLGPIVLLVAAAFSKFNTAMIAAAASGGLFSRLATSLFGATTKLVEGSTTATTSMTAFGLSVRALGTATVVGAAVAGIGMLIDWVMRLKTEADATRSSLDSLGTGDFGRTQLAASKLLNSTDANTIESGAQQFTAISDRKLSMLGQKYGITTAQSAHAATNQLTSMIDQALAQKNYQKASELRATLADIRNLLMPSENASKFKDAIDALNETTNKTAENFIAIHAAAKKFAEDEAALAVLREAANIDHTIEPKPIPGPPPKQPAFDDTKYRVGEADNLRLLDQAQKDLDSEHKQALVSDEDFASKSDDIQAQRVRVAQMWLNIEQTTYMKWYDEKKKTATNVEKLDEDSTKKMAEFNDRQNKINADARDKDRKVGDEAFAHQQRITDELIAEKARANSLISGTLGNRGATQESQLQNALAGIQNSQAKLGIGPDAETQRIKNAIPLVQDLTHAELALKNIQAQRAQVQSDLAVLDNKYQRGEITLADQIKGTVVVHQQQIQLNNAEISQLQAQLTVREALAALIGTTLDPEQIAAVTAAIEKLKNENVTLGQTLYTNTQAVEAFNQAMAATAQFAGVFDYMNSGLGTFVGLISKATSGASQISGMIKSWMDMAAKAGNAGGGIGGFFSGFSPMQDKQNADGSTSKALGIGAAGLGAITFGASTAIAVASALYARAVQKAKDDMTKSIKGVTDELAAGTITIGQSLPALEAARKAAVDKYSQSKTGRSALKDMLPQFDQQIQQTINELNNKIKSFKDKLKDSLLGTGPFADFARQLMQLSIEVNDYLDAVAGLYGKASQQYTAALADVKKLYEETLVEAKAAYESQLMDANSQALQDAQNVLDLIQQQSDLYSQLADLADQKQQLEAQAKQDIIDQGKAQAQLDKSRADNAKKILDIEKQIAAVIQKAADDETAIRQRGILEAQETIAQQKAREIAQVRTDAQTQLDDLKQQLADANSATGDFTQQQADLNQQYADKLAALNKQEAALTKQVATTQHQIELNNIRLDVAQRIAGVEGSIFDITGNDLELERKRGEIQIQQAEAKVKQWQQVKELVDAIVTNGEPMFNAPPGFPQINVQIGDIIIAPTTGSTTPTPPTGPGSGNGGNDKPAPGDGRRPPKQAPDAFSAFERQFLS